MAARMAFRNEARIWMVEHVAFPVGQPWEHLFLALSNQLPQPITLRRVVPVGGVGVGTVARVTATIAAPAGNNQTTVPEGLYQTYPPVSKIGSRPCLVQKLRLLNGMVLRHDQETRVLVQLRGLRPGTVRYTGYEVSYTVGNHLEREYVPVGYQAFVRAGIPPHPLANWEKPCLDMTHVLSR